MSDVPATPVPRAKLRPSNGRHAHYRFRLYVAGNGPNSKQALFNLRSLCKERLNGDCTIETVDVVKNFAAAVKDNILVTPALVLVTPSPRVVVLGNLSDRQKLLLALGFREGDS